MNITVNINIPAIDNLAAAILTLGGQAKAAQTESEKNIEVDPKPEKQPNSNESTEPENIPTVVELRAMAQEKGKTPEGKKAIKALLDKFDSESISKVPEKDRSAFLAELEAL